MELKSKSSVLCAIVIVAFSVSLFYAFKSGIEKAEALECAKWLGQSEEYIDWYAPNYMVEQCIHYGIDLSKFEK